MMDAGLAIEVAVKGVLVLAAACTLYALMRRYAASQRHLVLSVAMVGMLLIPAFAILLPNITVPIHAQEMESSVSQAPVTVSTVTPPPPIEPMVEPIGITEQPGSIAVAAQEFVATSNAASFDFSWPAAIAVVWGVGFAACLFPLMIGLMGIRAVRRSGRALVDPEWTGALRAARVGLGVTMRVSLIESPRARVPMTWGIFRGYIALPESAQDWSPQRRQVVLCHELAHIRRRDFLTQLIARVACAAHWFNPLSWWALRAMSLERERACDDLVVESGVRAPDYAEHLLQIVRDMRGASLTARTAIAMAGHSRLEQRVRALLDATQKRRSLGGGAHMATACVILACVAFLGMLQPIAVAQDAEDSNAEDTNIVIINGGDDGEQDVQVIRKDRDHHHVIRNDGERDHNHDLSEILEAVAAALQNVDIDAVIEHAVRSIEDTDVQEKIDSALKQIENVDVNAEIERAFDQIDTIELSDEDLADLKDVDREELRRQMRELRRQLRDAHVQEQLGEARLHLREMHGELNAHMNEVRQQLREVQKSDEWQEAVEDIGREVDNIDFEAILKAVGDKLNDVDIEPILEAAMSKVDEIDVEGLLNSLNEHIENVEAVVDTPAAPFAQPASQAEMEALLEKSDLRRANLHQAKLRGMDLHGKDLRGAMLTSADLREANLEGADLRNADLSGANLREANLRDAKLVGARLNGANLRDTDLTGVLLRGVDLSDVDTRGAKISAFVPSQ